MSEVREKVGFTAGNDDTRWLLSQHKDQLRDGDKALPPVRADAMTEAYNFVQMLQRASRISPQGEIVISYWAVRRMALRIAEIAANGLEGDEPRKASEASHG